MASSCDLICTSLIDNDIEGDSHLHISFGRLPVLNFVPVLIELFSLLLSYLCFFHVLYMIFLPGTWLVNIVFLYVIYLFGFFVVFGFVFIFVCLLF